MRNKEFIFSKILHRYDIVVHDNDVLCFVNVEQWDDQEHNVAMVRVVAAVVAVDSFNRISLRLPSKWSSKIGLKLGIKLILQIMKKRERFQNVFNR